MDKRLEALQACYAWQVTRTPSGFRCRAVLGNGLAVEADAASEYGAKLAAGELVGKLHPTA
jgi:hypothetical protein